MCILCVNPSSMVSGRCSIFSRGWDMMIWCNYFPPVLTCSDHVNVGCEESSFKSMVSSQHLVARSLSEAVGRSRAQHCSHVSILLLLLHRFVWELWGNSRIWCLIISNYYINILIGAINIFRLTHHVTWRSSGLGAEVSIGFSVSQGLVIAWLFRIRVWFWG